MAKRLTILLLVLILCISSLTSCFIVINKPKGDKNTEVTTQKPVETVEPMPDVLEEGRKDAESILEKDFGGKNFEGQTFIVVNADDTSIFIEAEQETSVSRAVELQKNLVAKKLNCNIIVNNVEYATFLSDALAAKNAGMFYADLVCVPQKALGYMRTMDMVANLGQLYGDVFGEEYFYLDSKSQTSGNNSFFGIAGRGAITPAAYGCLYFNKTVTDLCGVTNTIYESVENGTWTVDKMHEIKRLCGDAYGYLTLLGASDNETVVRGLYSSSGMKYIQSGMSLSPVLADNGDRFTNFINMLQTMFVDTSCVVSDNAVDSFEEGYTLFYASTLEEAALIKGKYGIVPMPKLDETQDRYYSYATENARLYAVLNTNNRPQFVPDVLKALNGTAQIVHDAWARDYLDYILRDSKSYGMIKLIFDSASYDMAYMFGENYPSVAESTYVALENAIVSNVPYGDSVKKQTVQFAKDMAAIFP